MSSHTKRDTKPSEKTGSVKLVYIKGNKQVSYLSLSHEEMKEN